MVLHRTLAAQSESWEVNGMKENCFPHWLTNWLLKNCTMTKSFGRVFVITLLLNG